MEGVIYEYAVLSCIRGGGSYVVFLTKSYMAVETVIQDFYVREITDKPPIKRAILLSPLAPPGRMNLPQYSTASGSGAGSVAVKVSNL